MFNNFLFSFLFKHRISGHGSRVTWLILGSRQPVELLQVQRIICYTGNCSRRKGKMCKSIKYSRTTFLCNSSLFRGKWIQLLFGRRKVLYRAWGKNTEKGVCLKDNQFVFDKFLLFKNQGPVSQASRLSCC